MKIVRAYRTELKPNAEQRSKLYRFAGAVRFVYNWALAMKIEHYKATGKTLRQRDLQPILQTALRAEYPWLADAPSTTLLAALQNNDRAFNNFFRRVKSSGGTPGFPKFKSRRKGIGGFKFFTMVRVEEGAIYLPKLGRVRLYEKGYLPAGAVKILSGAVTEHVGRWFVSITVEEDWEVVPATGEVLGVDLGVSALATLSDGTRYENPHALVKHERKMCRLQRKFARQMKGGKNQGKTKKKVARLHYQISNIRRDTLHKTSHDITANRKPSAVVVEDLNVAGMMKNEKLARHIADAGMSELRRQLIYKARWYGSELVTADRWYASSKTCSACGAVKKELKLSARVYCCNMCGHTCDRDENAARNLAMLAAFTDAFHLRRTAE